MAPNKMMALKHICVVFFVLSMTSVNCKTYPPRIESICLSDCVYFIKYNDYKELGDLPRPELENLCKNGSVPRFECELKWEYDGGYISG
uniref:Putative ovule protein n=1 Tax=Solanum chacoense TaxID=4108 RepID=A0A0V0GJN7_SOLCH